MSAWAEMTTVPNNGLIFSHKSINYISTNIVALLKGIIAL